MERTIAAYRRDVHDAILCTTMLVAEHGLHAVTMSRIAEEADADDERLARAGGRRAAVGPSGTRPSWRGLRSASSSCSSPASDWLYTCTDCDRT